MPQSVCTERNSQSFTLLTQPNTFPNLNSYPNPHPNAGVEPDSGIPPFNTSALNSIDTCISRKVLSPSYCNRLFHTFQWVWIPYFACNTMSFTAISGPVLPLIVEKFRHWFICIHVYVCLCEGMVFAIRILWASDFMVCVWRNIIRIKVLDCGHNANIQWTIIILVGNQNCVDSPNSLFFLLPTSLCGYLK